MSELHFLAPKGASPKDGEFQVMMGQNVIGKIHLKPDGYRYYHGSGTQHESEAFATLEEVKAYVHAKH